MGVMNYKTYMRSIGWKEKRQAKLEACNSKCECKGGCTRQATQVHHLHYNTLGNESMEDLQALGIRTVRNATWLNLLKFVIFTAIPFAIVVLLKNSKK